MADGATEHDELLQLTSDIVTAYVSKNAVPIGEIPGLIQSVYASLSGLAAPAVEPEVDLKPAVNPKRSVSDDAIVCLDCGRKLKMLKRHLTTDHDMTTGEYRAKWGLPHDFPMVAPNYSKKRQQLAKRIGLGRKKKSAA